MLKQSLLLIVLSAAAIFFKAQLGKVLLFLLHFHNTVAVWLGAIFSSSPAGQIILSILALIIIPAIVGLIVGLIYWMIRRCSMKRVMSVVWGVWLVLLVTLLVQSA